MTTLLSIDAYKRKQNVLAAKAHARRVGASSNQRAPKSKEAYTAEQRRYLNTCVEKHIDPDARLLAALREARFVLKLDRFGEDELGFHMNFLQKTKYCKHISLSLGSVAINRDLRTKFDRLGLKRAYAYENQGATTVVRSACSSAYKTPELQRFHLMGVKILPEVVPLLAKLHGVIKDEAVWSSSLRGEAAPNTSMPELLINLSRNTLGDATAETICDALYNDKWLLGLNLGGNKISQQGTEAFIDTLANNNKTIAVLGLANMKEPVATSTLDTLDSLLRVRNRFLQQVATESREKRMALGSLLLDWGIDKDTIVEICYLETLGKHATVKSTNASKKPALVSPKARSSLVHPRASNNNIRASQKLHSNNNDEDDDSNNNDEDEGGNGDSDSEDGEVAATTADSHVKTIKYLIERLSALESERRKTQAYVSKLEAENQQLRVELEARTTSPPSPGISPIEAQIIAQLETSISCLAEQVEIMEHENSAANIAEEA
ncbi:hypothetical protein PR001_g1955 [Phytophthora rubi]|uniref:Uncharacterized protein n=1 Tax=Phytophthora rubi TaxID=129364 RepID=A0A6A3P788_9STRA|nr:hypothetical protein PR001_g1955 [Phytophthora rubi]